MDRFSVAMSWERHRVSVSGFGECDICEDPATYKVEGFGDCCRTCKNEVVADLNIDEEDGVTRL